MWDEVEVLPALYTEEKDEKDVDRYREAWSRIAAYFAQRKPNTRTGYVRTLRQWCSYIGAEIGTAEGARRMCAASDLEAQAYALYIRGLPGVAPRTAPLPTSESREIDTRRVVIPEEQDGTLHAAAPATVAYKLIVLRRVYRILHGGGLADKNIFESPEIVIPSTHEGVKRPTEMVDFSLVPKMLDAPGRKFRERDRAILALLFYCGLRRSELVRLRIRDVGKKGRIWFLHLRLTKGKRDAEQPIPDAALDYFLPHLEARKDSGATDDDPLFVSSQRGAGMSASNIYYLFVGVAREVGALHATPHSARATAITKLLDQGIPYREVQEFSRHSSVQMVEAYDKRRIGLEKNPGRKLTY